MVNITDWASILQTKIQNEQWFVRKRELYKKRNAEIVRTQGEGSFFRVFRYDHKTYYSYLLHLALLIKQKDYFYMEETVIPLQLRIHNGEVVEHERIEVDEEIDRPSLTFEEDELSESERFSYDRRAAVQYAERWWNSYNPDYRKFDVDCTNYVSQCLRAGGAPMRGAPNRSNGWWYGNDSWSYSWAVSHSLRWYLSGSTQGLKGTEVHTPEQLLPGDVICYDFQGDGRWDHSTIVVAKDAEDMPLVNAHTDNSRMRYWAYEDSTAWTPDIQYKFFQIG